MRQLPELAERIETGPAQFGDDWPCTIIRGDCSFAYAMALTAAIEIISDPIVKIQLKNLKDLLKECQL